MPKIVDRDARRAEIVDAYLTVAARDGARAATSRAVAAELGIATGALWHYFGDFDAVLSASLSRTFANTTARMREQTSGKRGMPALAAVLGEILPLDEVAQHEATVVVAFWGRVATEPQMGEIQAKVEQTWREILTEHVDEAIADGELVPHTPIADLVDTLLVLTTGQQVEYVVRTAVGAPSRQWPLIEHVLLPWRTPQGV